jgi:hypothetical protein
MILHLELTRFRGHLIFIRGGVHYAKIKTTVSAGGIPVDLQAHRHWLPPIAQVTSQPILGGLHLE